MNIVHVGENFEGSWQELAPYNYVKHVIQKNY
jgi:hypothetical protein